MPGPERVDATLTVLRVSLALLTLGLGGPLLLGERSIHHGRLGSFLCGWWDAPLRGCGGETVALSAMVGCGAVLVTVGAVPGWWRTRWTSAVGLSLMLVAWTFVGIGVEDGPRIRLLGEHLPRWWMPLAFAALVGCAVRAFGSDAPGNLQARADLRRVYWSLLVALTGMLAAYAWKTAWRSALTTQLLSESLRRWSGQAVGAATIEWVMGLAALFYLLGMVAIWFPRGRGMFCVLAAWGMITALSRLSAFGLLRWDESLLRISSSGMLIAAWLLRPVPPAPKSFHESCLHSSDRSSGSH